MTDEHFLRLAVSQARAAESQGEVPVGSVVVLDGKVVGTGHNRVIADFDPTAHAEIVALRAAGKTLGNYRLLGCTLYTTLEPCVMCAGAILHARVTRLVYGATDAKAGACGSVLSILDDSRLNHQVEISAGVLSEECSDILSTFFRRLRLGAS